MTDSVQIILVQSVHLYSVFCIPGGAVLTGAHTDDGLCSPQLDTAYTNLCQNKKKYHCV